MNKDKRYSDDFYLVNQILAEWNPIDVPDTVAETEYTMYVTNMLRFRNDLDGVVKEMEKIVINIGLDTNIDQNQRQDILTFANKIIHALNDNQLISYSDLSEATEVDTSDNRVKANAEFLLNAITDYPTLNLKEPVDFLNELKNEIGFPLTYELIDNYESKLSFDDEDDVWKKEALSSVLEMFTWDKTKTLDDLVKEISKHYKVRSNDTTDRNA